RSTGSASAVVAGAFATPLGRERHEDPARGHDHGEEDREADGGEQQVAGGSGVWGRPHWAAPVQSSLAYRGRPVSGGGPLADHRVVAPGNRHRSTRGPPPGASWQSAAGRGGCRPGGLVLSP